MARPRKIDSDLVTQAQRVAAHTGHIQESRMAQAILLPALGQMTLKAAGKVIGVGRATVARLQGRFRRWKQGIQAPRRRWGGRRRALMKLEDEESFLAGWKSKAEQGELVVVTALHGALEQKVGHRLKPSVVIACWSDTIGEKWLRTLDTPRPSRQCRRSGKKNATGRAGGLVESRCCARAPHSIDVPGRGPFWPHGPDSPLLGAGSLAPGSAQRLRAGVHLCVWWR